MPLSRKRFLCRLRLARANMVRKAVKVCLSSLSASFLNLPISEGR
jgi:hypothetical protein